MHSIVAQLAQNRLKTAIKPAKICKSELVEEL